MQMPMRSAHNCQVQILSSETRLPKDRFGSEVGLSQKYHVFYRPFPVPQTVHVCVMCISGPDPPTSTSEKPTTHTCEDGWTQCEVIIANHTKKTWGRISLTTFSLEYV